MVSVGAANLFQDARRWNARASLLEVAAHRLVDVLQRDRPIFNQPELHRVVTVTTCGHLLLHHDARPRLDDRHRRDRAIFGEQLRHPNFAPDDSINHLEPRPMSKVQCLMSKAQCQSLTDFGHWILDFGQIYCLPNALISTSTPAGRSSFMSASTVCGVGSRISINRLCVRISNCSRDFLSTCGERKTVHLFFDVGSGIGPATRAPVRFAVSTICEVAWSSTR